MALTVSVKARKGMLAVVRVRSYYTEAGTNRQVLTERVRVAFVDKAPGGQVRTLRDAGTDAVFYFGGMDPVHLDTLGEIDPAKVRALFHGVPADDFDTLDAARSVLRSCSSERAS